MIDSGTRYASPEEKALLTQMSGPLLEQSDAYVFDDKQTIECMHTAGTMTDATYDSIKSDLASLGTSWDALPNKLERLQVGTLGLWEFTN